MLVLSIIVWGRWWLCLVGLYDYCLMVWYDFWGSDMDGLVEWMTIFMLWVQDNALYAPRPNGHVQEYKSWVTLPKIWVLMALSISPSHVSEVRASIDTWVWEPIDFILGLEDCWLHLVFETLLIFLLNDLIDYIRGFFLLRGIRPTVMILWVRDLVDMGYFLVGTQFITCGSTYLHMMIMHGCTI